MESPKVSVVIPVYNGARHVGEAIQSVLDQSYANIEVVVVDDASTDSSSEVIAHYHDPRLIYIRHKQNQGSNVARNTGITTATGEIIAFLDQDDYFHPEKIHLHVEYYKNHPDVGFTYNSRFELNYGSKTVRDIWRPPNDLTPADFLLGFPIAPSDMVITRDWAQQVGTMTESIHFYGGEYVWLGQLYFNGCKFGHVDRVLNYRRHHPGRNHKDVKGSCESELTSQEIIFGDPRTPLYVLELRNIAHSNTYLVWAYYALAQGETRQGQEYLLESLRLNPSIATGQPSHLLEFLVDNCIADDSLDHTALLKKILDQMPAGLKQISNRYEFAVSRGYLIKGVRAIMWDRYEAGKEYLSQAISRAAQLDEPFMRKLSHQLANYEAEFDPDATKIVIDNLTPYLEKLGGRTRVRWLKGHLAFNRAMYNYRSGKPSLVTKDILNAVANNPRYLANRGSWSIFGRSIVNSTINKVK